MLETLEEVHDGRVFAFRPDWKRSIPGGYVQDRQTVRTFQARTSVATDDPVAVYEAALVFAEPLPPVWSLHPEDKLMRLSHHELSQMEFPEDWLIRCNYSTLPSPLDEPAVLDWGNGSIERVFEGAFAYVAFDGSEHLPTQLPYPGLTADDLYPITNSALLPFDPPPSDQEYYRVLTVNKNYSLHAFDPKQIDANFSRRVNSELMAVPHVQGGIGTAYGGFERGTVFLAEPPRAKLEFRNNVEYFATTWVFWIRARGWNLRLVDVSYYELQGPDDYTSEPRPIILNNGQPVQNAWKLNGHGVRAAVGDPMVFLSYRVRAFADFNSLGLFDGLL